MSQYRAPLADIGFLLKDVFNLDRHAEQCGIEFDSETALAIAKEAGKFASERIDAISRKGDTQGARWADSAGTSAVTTADGFKEAYADFCAGGWNGLRFPEEYGGQGLCAVIATLVDEMWHAGSLSFALCPMLTNGAVEALLTAASDELKAAYLPKLVSGQWTGTMNLTEPQAGSDLAAVQTRAVKQADGSYRIGGQKIFITYGEHDMAENIIHLVLARTPDAPKGVKGIFLFEVPAQVREQVIAYAYDGAEGPEAGFIGGERWIDFRHRVLAAWQELIARPDWKSLLVAHDAVNRMLLSHLAGSGLASLKAFEQDPACINVIDVDVAAGQLRRAFLRTVNLAPYDPIRCGMGLTVMERLFREYQPNQESHHER